MSGCKHDTVWMIHSRANLADFDVAECQDCEALGVASLGPSNDEPAEVLLEIRAAERIAAIAEHGGGGDPDVWCGDETTEIVGGPWQDKFNATYWSWDPSRPIAEQMADTARDDADADDALCLKSQHDSDPGRLAQLMADDDHTALTIRQYTGLVEVGIETDHADGCADGPYRIGRCEMCDTEPTVALDTALGRIAVLGAKDPNEDAMRDPAVTAHNAEVIAQRSLVASPEVCACTGDALLSEKCEVVP